jgi:drug/metabolite transporter (DMT)-like permease
MTEAAPSRWKSLVAFAVIYLVWGSTFLFIRIGVQEVPPLLLASMRFVIAGGALFGWMAARGGAMPSRREWGSVAILAFLIFLVDYGCLFWAEKRVPSGVAAVLLATIPAFMALSEITMLRTQRLTVRLGFALLVGFGGIAVLTSSSLRLGGEPVDRIGAFALVASAVSWSIASALARKLPLPASKPMSSGAQMLVGGIFLAIAAAGFGELHGFSAAAISLRAWIALAYLVVAGSIIGFTAYVWLLHHYSPTKVGTYAYVNPVVAVILGYFFGGEPLGLRTVAGTACVLISVLVITTARPRKAPAVRLAGGAEETA